MNKEMKALYRNETWEITNLPKGRKPISSKWVFKIKYKSTGEVERYKARLVAKGFNQKEGIEYEETFSPVVKMVIVRPGISYVVHKLSQAMHCPLKSDSKLAFRVLRYLKGAPRIGVMYKPSDGFELTVFVNSDWAKCNVTMRSMTGFTVFFGSCLVSRKSKKRAAMQIAANLVFHERTKHFKIYLYFLREKINEEVIEVYESSWKFRDLKFHKMEV
nr:hypothetical protein [Tanacetum cinerariifolium]